MFSKLNVSVRTWMILGVVCTVLAGLTAIAWAQDAPEVPYPFFYLIKAKVDATKMEGYMEAIGKIVDAHKQHDNGNNWAAFAPMFGGPEPVFYYFLPAGKLAELDDWLPNFKVVADIHGEATADQIFRTVGETSKTRSTLLAYAPGISNPNPDWSGTVPAFVDHMHIKAEPGKVTEYVALIKKLVAAHKDHPQGLHWVGYTVFAGGETGEFHFFIGMQKLGEMDAWPMGPEMIEEKYGKEETAKLLSAFPKLAKARDELLAHNVEMSNLPPAP